MAEIPKVLFSQQLSKQIRVSQSFAPLRVSSRFDAVWAAQNGTKTVVHFSNLPAVYAVAVSELTPAADRLGPRDDGGVGRQTKC